MCKAQSLIGNADTLLFDILSLTTAKMSSSGKEKITYAYDDTVHVADCLEAMKNVPDKSADLIICDPPYNFGKDFGNDSDKKSESEYLEWCDKWVAECHRILKPTGTCYIYNFSTTLSLVHARLHNNKDIKWKMDWLVWHYTNKTNPRAKTFQRSHESLLYCHFANPKFNRDLVRETYTEEYVKYNSNRVRPATSKGRINSKNIETPYNIHEDGALPRDVMKVPALAGANGKSEGVAHPSQKPLKLTERLIKSCMNLDGTPTNILIPFSGAGTEMLCCRNLENCHFLAFEINPEYVELSRRRLERD
jgi:site-specific DNA-methyltransferase (adenine-specific)